MKVESKKKLFFITGLILFSFFMTNRIFFFKQGFLEIFSHNIIYPLLAIGNKITSPIKILMQKRKTYQELNKTCLELKEENVKLLAENIKLKASINYQENNKELLSFQQRYNIKNAVLAKILAKNIAEDEHYFLLNRGTKDGIKTDMVAIYKFQIIGRITNVYKWHSKLLLVTDSKCKVAAQTNSTNAKGIVVGKNNLHSCNMDYVSHLSQIQEDDLVLSSGQGLIFPEGFCLGKITKCVTEELYHKIEIQPLTDLKTLRFCLLINQEKMAAF